MAARGRIRDRRGRGMRGPAVLPAAYGGTRTVPPRPTPRERFDDVVLTVVAELESRWEQQLGLVEYAVEDTPVLPEDWDSDTVPLSSLIRGGGATPSRIVLFRRPIEHRSGSREELEAMVLTVLVEQVAELLGMDAEDVDPRYRAD